MQSKTLVGTLACLGLLTACGGVKTPEDLGLEITTARQSADIVIEALKAEDVDTLAAMTHPENGVRFTPYTYVSTEDDRVVAAGDLKKEWKSSDKKNWGTHEGSGDPINLTFQEYYEEFIYKRNFASTRDITWNKPMKRGSMIDNAKEAYPDSHIVEYHMSATDNNAGLDWNSLRLVFEEYETGWYLSGVIDDRWTP